MTWAGLGRCWAVIVLTLAVGAGVLQWLGPPSLPEAIVGDPLQPKPAVEAGATLATAPLATPKLATGPVSRRDRIGLIVSGIGLNQADSEFAARSLPLGVTLAISPYVAEPEPLLHILRARKLEFLLMLALEPANFPIGDAGVQALVAHAPDEENLPRLRWMLSRISGYAGVISVETEARALRLNTLADLLTQALPLTGEEGAPMIRIHTGRGRLPNVWNRSVDLVLDLPDAGQAVDLRLKELTRLARGPDGAVGLATVPRTTTIERIVVWARGLREQGLVLTPMREMAFSPTEKGATHE